MFFFVHNLVFLLAKNAYFIIFSAYFDCIFRNFLVHKCMHITVVLSESNP
jgi:hypothetical protein